MIKKIISLYDRFFENCKRFDFIALLALRVYLVPAIFVGAHSKVLGFAGTVAWFGSPVAAGGLNLPFPELFAFIATATEVCGCICIALGLFTRIFSIPMIIMMSAAGAMVHWSHGWLAIASKDMESSQRMADFITWLSANFPGRYNYITELGDPVILNNGMEFSITYFVMLLVLFFYGGGRYVSADYWLRKVYLYKTKHLQKTV